MGVMIDSCKRTINCCDDDENNLRNLDVFDGNKDNTNVVKKYFKEPVLAKIIRLYVMEYVNYPSLRWELHYVMDKKYGGNNSCAPTIAEQ